MFTKLADAIERAIAEGKITREEVFRRMLESARASGVPEEAIRRAAQAKSVVPTASMSERAGRALLGKALGMVDSVDSGVSRAKDELGRQRALEDFVIGAVDPRSRSAAEQARRRVLAPALAREDAAKRDYRNISRELSDLMQPRSARLADLAGAQQLRNLLKTPGVEPAFDFVSPVTVPPIFTDPSLLEGAPEGLGRKMFQAIRDLRPVRADPGSVAHQALINPPSSEPGARIDAGVLIPRYGILPATEGRIARGRSTFGEKVRSALELVRGRRAPGALEAGAGWHEVGEVEAMRAHAGNAPMGTTGLSESVMKPVTLERDYSARGKEEGYPVKVPPQVHASHQDVRPRIREEMPVYGNPEARKFMRDMRERGADDQLASLMYRRVGGRANAPIAIDSRQERAMRREMARQRDMGNVSALVPHVVASVSSETLPRMTDADLRLPSGALGGHYRGLSNAVDSIVREYELNPTVAYTGKRMYANRLAEKALSNAARTSYVPKSIYKK